MKPVAAKKWIPAAAAPVLVAAIAVGAGASARAEVTLEPKSPQEVLEMIANSKDTDFSGNLTAAFDLGLPQLPDGEGFGPSDPGMSGDPGASDAPEETGPGDSGADKLAHVLSALSGTHEARIYADKPDKLRLQVMDGMDEQDLIRNGTELWHWDSATNTAERATLPEDGMRHWDEGGTGESMTPDELARKFLEDIDPSTMVEVNGDVRIAGRDAYSLELTPRTEDTLVAGVSIGVDAETGVPLGVTVDAVGQADPAISVEFTDFTPETPDAARFDFTPPEGATIREHDMSEHMRQRDMDHGDVDHRDMGDGDVDHRDMGGKDMGDGMARDGMHGKPETVGSGWETVAVLSGEQVPAELLDSAMLDQLSVPVEGGRLVHTALLNVLVTDEGEVLVGAVPEARLQAVADGR